MAENVLILGTGCAGLTAAIYAALEHQRSEAGAAAS